MLKEELELVNANLKEAEEGLLNERKERAEKQKEIDRLNEKLQ